MTAQSSLSVVLPIYNEERNIPELLARLTHELQGRRYEILAVDDGSTDGSLATLLELQAGIQQLRVVKLHRNYGQTTAMDAGFACARNDIVVTLDADLQNPVDEILKVIGPVEGGYDVACGWRRERHDSFSKKFLSRIAYFLRKTLLNDTLHDAGCTLKAYRRECLDGLQLFGETHRFIHLILQWRGCRITEVPVAHSARRHGKSKYGTSRLVKGLLDLFALKFWLQYSSKPIYVFGTLGIGLAFPGFLIGTWLVFMRVFFGEPLADRPLLLLAIGLVVVGTQFLFFGLLADMMTKLYYSTSDDRHYIIQQVYEPAAEV